MNLQPGKPIISLNLTCLNYLQRRAALNTTLHRLTMLLAFLCLMPFFVQAQNFKHRTVERTEFDAPVEIVSLEIAGHPARFNDKIMAGKDWLKTLKLEFKNLHDKSIVYISVELEIAPTGKMDLPLRLPLTFGVRPDVPMAQLDKKTLKKLAPNNTKKLVLSEYMSDFLDKYMREQEIEDIEKVKVYVEFIIFEDGVGWADGVTMHQDAQNPNKWVVDGNWIKRPISILKNRYGGPPPGPLPPDRQYSSHTISSQTCGQNTNNQTFNYMMIGHKFFPSPYGKIFRNWTPADDVVPNLTCYYRISKIFVTCGSSPCGGTNSYCIAEKEILGREGAFGSGGAAINANVPCNPPFASSSCTCPQSTKQELRVSRIS